MIDGLTDKVFSIKYPDETEIHFSNLKEIKLKKHLKKYGYNKKQIRSIVKQVKFMFKPVKASTLKKLDIYEFGGE